MTESKVTAPREVEGRAFMPRLEWEILAYLMDVFEQQLSSAGCNDLPSGLVEQVPTQEWIRINREYAAHNNDANLDEYGSHVMPDWCYFSLIREKLKRVMEHDAALDAEARG